MQAETGDTTPIVVITEANSGAIVTQTGDSLIYRNEVYGYESEYTYPILIAEVENILTDLTTLVNNTDFFIKLSTYNERQQIGSDLNNILYNLESSSLWQYVDNIKIMLRNYNVHIFLNIK